MIPLLLYLVVGGLIVGLFVLEYNSLVMISESVKDSMISGRREKREGLIPVSVNGEVAWCEPPEDPYLTAAKKEVEQICS